MRERERERERMRMCVRERERDWGEECRCCESGSNPALTLITVTLPPYCPYLYHSFTMKMKIYENYTVFLQPLKILVPIWCTAVDHNWTTGSINEG